MGMQGLVFRLFGCIAMVVLASACGGPGSQTEASESGPQASESGPGESSGPRKLTREEALAQLEARQEAACERVGTALYRCAVEDSRGNVSPDEVAELELPETQRRYEAKFMAKCLAGDMSPRQVRVFEKCVADTRCAVFVPCLDEARPRR